MLGWMLKRGDNAPAANDGDTTQADQPDTPAPVFAARAFKSALFGTPLKRSDDCRAALGKSASTKATKSTARAVETPPRPPGILMTPGTGTSKRKRVSFGHDVPRGSATNLTRITELDEPTDSRLKPTASPQMHSKSVKDAAAAAAAADAASDDEWEEAGEEDCSPHDGTTDLNEPHSQSGQYWKEEFLKYHREAKAEMEKLLKYKQLAKSYAQQKDAEAIELASRLRDEQQRVTKMESKIAEDASRITKQQQAGEDATDLLGKLNKQTRLAAEYRQRVQELEARLEELRVKREREKNVSDETPRRRYAPTPAVAATQKTLTDTRRELRRTRSQLKEMDALRDEVFALKMQLKKAELKLAVNEKEEARTRGGPRAQELRVLLKAAKEESKRKDEDIRQLKINLESLRRESEAHDADKTAVLERAHSKMAELRREIKMLKSAGQGQARPNSWHPQTSNVDRRKGMRSEELARHKIQASGPRGLDEKMNQDSRHEAQSRTLREKFMDDGSLGSKLVSGGTEGQMTSDKSKWQPSVARSPRNRGYLAQEGAKRNVEDKARATAAPMLPPIPQVSGFQSEVEGGEGHGRLDLDPLSGRLARLGGPGSNNHVISKSAEDASSKSRSTLPPEIRAAALAKIEKRMAEKKRLRDGNEGWDKENMQPHDV